MTQTCTVSLNENNAPIIIFIQAAAIYLSAEINFPLQVAEELAGAVSQSSVTAKQVAKSYITPPGCSAAVKDDMELALKQLQSKGHRSASSLTYRLREKLYCLQANVLVFLIKHCQPILGLVIVQS